KGMVYRDPPDHTRMRALVNKAFTRNAVETIRPRIEAIVNELCDAVRDGGKVDLIRAFAYPVPVTVIAEVIGVPPELAGAIKTWSNDIATLMLGELADEGRHARADRALGELSACFREIVRDRRRSPKSDLASALIAARDDKGALDENELVGMCALM